MNWDLTLYYTGYAFALALCRGLGKLFFIPMLLNAGFNLALELGLFSGWDIRWVLVGYGFLFFLWVAALAGIFDRVTVVILLVVDLLAVFKGVLPQIQSAGTGGHFWDVTSTTILHVWLLSVFVVSLSAIAKSSLLSKIERGYSELLIIPKRRFLIPIALWAAVIVLPDYLGKIVPDVLSLQRYSIASQLLVWGWVAFELPFYIMYKRMRDHAD